MALAGARGEASGGETRGEWFGWASGAWERLGLKGEVKPAEGGPRRVVRGWWSGGVVWMTICVGGGLVCGVAGNVSGRYAVEIRDRTLMLRNVCQG